MKKIAALPLLLWLIVIAFNAQAQQPPQASIAVSPPTVINFTQLANAELLNPPVPGTRPIEQGEEFGEELDFDQLPVPPNAARFDVTIQQGGSRAVSPAPVLTFDGVMATSSGGLTPPDIRGAVGPSHVFQTTNKEFKIFNKSGTLLNTVSFLGFFSSAGATWVFDPHILYDPANGRWLACSGGENSSNQSLMYLAVSQTNNPTGSWYVYQFVTSGTTVDFLDYPLMGFNTNWVAISANVFLNGQTYTGGRLYVMNRASLYAGTLGTASMWTDYNMASVMPAETYDPSQTTLYTVQNWNGNSNGYGYVRIGRITGTPNAPLYTTGSSLGVNQTWSSSNTGSPQLGTTARIDAIGTRIGNAVYRNGSLWFCHTAFLPTSSPSRAVVQWWQANPATPALQQFGRIDGGSSSGIFYSIPSIAVNANNDVMVGHCQSSVSSYPSASYSIRLSSDAPNTIQTPYMYKAGLSYYAGGRWGDYTGCCVDPSDNSFWNFNEWANAGNRWATVIANVVVPNISCGTPSTLSAAPVGNTYATLNWSAVAGATSYRVQYRATGTSTWSTATTINTNYSATGLIQGTGYEWQVQSICSSATSVYSSVMSFATTGTAPCAIPTSLFAGVITTTSATLSWGAVSGATSYNIRYRVVGSATWLTVISTTTSRTITGLTAASNYEWQVQAVCSGSSSSYSSSVTFTTQANITCGVPTGLTTTNITSTSAILSWGAVTGATGYTVYYKPSSSSTWSTSSASTNSKTLTNLVANTSYQWAVYATCSGTSSGFSSIITFTTLTATTCSTPTGLMVTNITSSSATLNWSAVSGATSYAVYYRIAGSSTWTGTSASTTSKTLTGLSSSTSYQWAVYAICSGSSSALSSIATFTTLSSGSCTAPVGLSAANIAATSATLSWTAVPGAVSYNIQYRVVGTSTWIGGISTAATSYNLTGLTMGTNYEWQVRTVCSGATSAYSSAVSFATVNASCATTTNTWEFLFFGNSLQWSAVSGAISYNVRYRKVGTTTWTNVNTTSTSYSLPSLPPGTTYEWQVQTVCSGGTSAYSSLDTFRTSGIFNPCSSSVITPAIGTVTTTTAALSWTYISSATSYDVQYRVVGISTWSIVSSFTNSYTLSGLVPGTSYEWQVRVNCSAGTSEYYPATNPFITSSTTSCNLPTLFTTGTITSSTAAISWTAASGATSYNIRYRAFSSSTWLTATTSSTSYTLSGLASITDYVWQVRSVCSFGTSAYITAGSFVTGGSGCPTPSNDGWGGNCSYLRYFWNPVSGATSYVFRYRITGNYDWVSVPLTDTFYYFYNFALGTSHDWHVRAVCSGSNSSYCSVISGPASSTCGTTPCRIPTYLKAVSITANSAVLTWTSVSGAISYNVQYRIVGTAPWVSGTTTTNAYNATGLSPNTDYEWQVGTVCANGSSTNANSLVFTTGSLPACSDNFESNNTSAAAKVITANTSFPAYITPSTDEDWYKFTTVAPYTKIEIDLTNLAADYDLLLYASDAVSQLAVSQYRGTTSEQIKYANTSAATYYLKVVGYNGANSASQCYQLALLASAVQFSPLELPDESRSVTDIEDVITPEHVMKLYPNPASDELTIEFTSAKEGNVKFCVYNLDGQIMRRDSHAAMEGTNAFVINTSELTSGIYLLELENNGTPQRATFAISK